MVDGFHPALFWLLVFGLVVFVVVIAPDVRALRDVVDRWLRS